MRRALLPALWSLALCGRCFAVNSGASDAPSTRPARASQSEVTDMQPAFDETQLSAHEEVLVRSREESMPQDLAVAQLQIDKHAQRVITSPLGEVISESAVARMRNDLEETLATAGDQAVLGSSVARPPASAPIPEDAGGTQLHRSKPHGQLERNQRVVVNARGEALPEGPMSSLGENSHSESDGDADQLILDDVFWVTLYEPLPTAADKAVLGSSAAHSPAEAPIPGDAGATPLQNRKTHQDLERNQRFVISAGALPEDSMATIGEESALESDEVTDQSSIMRPGPTPQVTSALLLQGALHAGIAPSWATSTQSMSFYRFSSTKARGGGDEFHISEVSFRYEGAIVRRYFVHMSQATATYEGAANASVGAAKAIEGSTSTKAVTVKFPAATPIDEFSFTTANDAPGRDPVQWTLEGSADGITWLTLHSQEEDYATPINRRTQTPWFSARCVSLRCVTFLGWILLGGLFGILLAVAVCGCYAVVGRNASTAMSNAEETRGLEREAITEKVLPSDEGSAGELPVSANSKESPRACEQDDDAGEGIGGTEDHVRISNLTVDERAHLKDHDQRALQMNAKYERHLEVQRRLIEVQKKRVRFKSGETDGSDKSGADHSVRLSQGQPVSDVGADPKEPIASCDEDEEGK